MLHGVSGFFSSIDQVGILTLKYNETQILLVLIVFLLLIHSAGEMEIWVGKQPTNGGKV